MKNSDLITTISIIVTVLSLIGGCQSKEVNQSLCNISNIEVAEDGQVNITCNVN